MEEQPLKEQLIVGNVKKYTHEMAKRAPYPTWQTKTTRVKIMPG
jgi:hypothetical protein